MSPAYLLFFVSFFAFAQTKPRIELIPGPKTAEDYEHQYKGCLENSECDQVMGLQLSRWRELVDKVKDPAIENAKKFRFLELFRQKYGIPVEFYTNQKSQQGFRPMLFDSHCKNHNMKDQPKIVKGTAFLKGLSETTAVVWRDQTQIEVPVGELLRPQPLYVYTDKGLKLYPLPLGDQPLFIKGGKLHILRETDDFFYMLTVSDKGDWEIINFDMAQLSTWEDRRSEVTCPQEKPAVDDKLFSVTFCKSIWNDDLKKNVTVRLYQGCVI